MSDTDQLAPSDKTKYIRTYAKDVASLTGTVAAPPPQKVPEPQPPRESPWDVPTATRDVAAMYNAPAPAPSASDVALDQLRAKVSSSAHMSLEQAVTDSVSSAVPIKPPAPAPQRPSFTQSSEHYAPQAAIATQAKPAPLPGHVPSGIHTYKSDFADRIDQKGASTFSVLAAEADSARTTPKPLPVPRRGLAFALSGALLLVLGGSGIFAAYWYVARMNVLPDSPLAVPSLVFADERVRLTGTGPELFQALATTADEPLVDGNVLITYLSESTTTPKGGLQELPLAGGALIRALQLPAPDILLRNVTLTSTVGIISAGVESRPFFIFRVTSYERTFAGMLAWEGTIGRDLALLYPAYSVSAINPEATAITVASSTPLVSEPPRQLGFIDAVVASHDVRALKDTGGNTLMLYGYADKETLILARNEAAFSALLIRLAAGK